MSIVGENIKKRRKQLNLSQSALAKRAGVSQSAISDIETSTKNPSVETIRLLAVALCATSADLMGEKEEAAPETGDSLKAEGVFILNTLSENSLKQAVNYLRFLSKNEDTQ